MWCRSDGDCTRLRCLLSAIIRDVVGLISSAVAWQAVPRGKRSSTRASPTGACSRAHRLVRGFGLVHFCAVQSTAGHLSAPRRVSPNRPAQSVFLISSIPVKTSLSSSVTSVRSEALAASLCRRPRRRPPHPRRAPQAGRPASHPALQVPRLVTATDACRSPGAIARCRVQSVFVSLGLDAPIVPSW